MAWHWPGDKPLSEPMMVSLMTHICVSDLIIIGSDNGLSPGRRQAIIRTSAGTLLYKTLRNKLQWNFNRNSNIFIQENAFESVVCEKKAILSRPQWVKTYTPEQDAWLIFCWWRIGMYYHEIKFLYLIKISLKLVSKYTHGFILLCFTVVMLSFLVVS